MYGINITSAEKLYVQANDTTILAIGFDVQQDGVTVASYNHGFDLDTTSDDVKTYMDAFIANWEANQVRAAANAQFDADNAVADETIASIVGTTITS